MKRIDETKQMIAELRKELSIEEIAVELERSVASIFKWSKGISEISKGDFGLLKDLLRRVKNGEWTRD